MLKMYGRPSVTFAEFPDEISVCVNISGCPNLCEGCSEPELREDAGTELTEENLEVLLKNYEDCTVFGLMGGDADHHDIIRIAEYVHEHSNMKVGFYSGMDSLDLELIPYIDLYKIGRWITPTGESSTWWKKNCGPLVFPFSNQLYFEKHENKLVNCTYKFRKQPINNLVKYIINDDKD